MTIPKDNLPGRLPLVSVIIPTRNRARLLQRAVRSVLAQSYAQLELIVVNDASTDDTLEVLTRFPDPRLRVITREKNSGAAAARNEGIRAARGELFAFQDDDDTWLLEKLEKQVAALDAAGSEVGWCIAGYFHFVPEGCKFVDREFYERCMDFSRHGGPDNTGYGWIATPGWLVRRQPLFAAGLFDERLRSWDDWELGLRLSQQCGRCFVNEPLFVQDQVQGGGMQRLEKARIDDMKLIIEKHGGLWAARPQIVARHALFIGKTLMFHGDRTQGRRWLLESLRHSPWRLRTWVLWLLSFSSTRLVVAARTGWSWLVGLRAPSG